MIFRRSCRSRPGSDLLSKKWTIKFVEFFLLFLFKYAPDIYLPSKSSSDKIVPPGRAVELFFKLIFFLFRNQYEKYEQLSINLTNY